MADDKTKTGKQDRDRVPVSDDYEVSDFADKFNLAVTTVRDLIKRRGNDRKTLEREARKVYRASQKELGPDAGKLRRSD